MQQFVKSFVRRTLGVDVIIHSFDRDGVSIINNSGSVDYHLFVQP